MMIVFSLIVQFKYFQFHNYHSRKGLAFFDELVPKLQNPSAHNRSPIIAIPKVRDADVLIIVKFIMSRPK